MHSITKNYNFSNIVKNVETFLPKCFEILLKILTNRNFGGAFAHPKGCVWYSICLVGIMIEIM